MKNYIFILIIFICVSFSALFSQTASNKDNAFNNNDFPQEKIFVHFNGSFLVSGENLFYKIYCLDASTNKLSNLSKIGYVELIDSDKNIVFKHKLILQSGLGKGEFFIKTSIPSGNYKLIAYTQWMRNGGVNTFFQNDITIINPFRANKKLTVNIPQQTDTILGVDSLIIGNENVENLNVSNKNIYLALETNKNIYSKREKIELTVKSLKDKLSYGNYSVSVKKIDSINAPSKLKSKSITNNNNFKIPFKDSIFFLPELRGELLSGTVFIKESNKPTPNVKVSLSIPGENAVFKIATTNKSGMFYFNLENEYENSNAIVQVIGSKRNEYEVELNQYELPNYNDIEFNNFKLTPKLNDLILKKSILNQIENAYYSIKNDSILPATFSIPSYNYREKTYFLNDYTRFKELKETVTEVVDAVFVLQKKGEYTFHIKFYNVGNNSDLLPLVLLDGVLIQDHNLIMDYDTKNINSIGVVRDKFVIGGQSFMGIISIKTFNGDYKYPLSGSHIKKVELIKPQVNKKYFKQEYNDSELKRIPDFRNQLLWQPNFVLSAHETLISFNASDNTGNYEICIEGYTKYGMPVSVREIIKVLK